MSAKHYLNEIRKDRATIRALRARLSELEWEATGLTAIRYDKDRVQVSPENRMETIIAEMDAERQKYLAAIRKYHEGVRLKEKQINDLDNRTYARFLELYYIEEDDEGYRPTLTAIAYRLGKSPANMSRLHMKALKAFERKFPKECRVTGR